MKRILLFSVIMFSLLPLSAQNERFSVQLGVGDFRAETQLCGFKSLPGIMNNLSAQFGVLMKHGIEIHFQTKFWSADPLFQSKYFGPTIRLECGDIFDSSLVNFISVQQKPIFLGIAISRRFHISPRLEYALGLDMQYFSVHNTIIDTIWQALAVTGDHSFVYSRSHREHPHGWGAGLNTQLDYRLSRKRPLYLGLDGSYTFYTMTPRRIIRYGLHLMYKFGKPKKKPQRSNQNLILEPDP